MGAHLGLFLVVCDDPGLASTLTHIQQDMDIRVWVPNKQSLLQTSLMEACEDADDNETLVKGDITKAAFFQQWSSYNPICVVLSLKNNEKYSLVRDNILQELPDAHILSMHIGHPDETPRRLATNNRELVLSWTELLSSPIRAELRHIESLHRVQKIRHLLDGKDKIALLVQPDPDPDSLASALALRVLLGRNKVSSPIVSFGKVTRPENVAMLKLLDLEVVTIKPEELNQFDKVALLDTQPKHFPFPLAKVDAVIDHHPLCQTGLESVSYVDIRPKYGATASILTEYLMAAAVHIGQRLSTALLYGIKSDTLLLNREVIDADLYAFMSLYPKINYNLLRRMEKPEIPQKFAPILANALLTLECQQNVLSSYLGPIEREDLIPQIADFLLQFEGAEWVLCSGVFNEQLIISVRNVGYVKHAGDAVKKIVQGWAQGGGHRTMAKAIFPLKDWELKYGPIKEQTIRHIILDLFLKEVELNKKFLE